MSKSHHLPTDLSIKHDVPKNMTANQPDLRDYRYLTWVSFLMMAFTPLLFAITLLSYFQSHAWQLIAFFIASLIYGVGGFLAYLYIRKGHHRKALNIIIITYWGAPGLGSLLITNLSLIMLTAAVYHLVIFTILYPEKLPFRIILINVVIFLVFCIVTIFAHISTSISSGNLWFLWILVFLADIAYTIPFYIYFKRIQLASKLLSVQMQITLVGFTTFALITNLSEYLQLSLIFMVGIIWLVTVWMLQVLTRPLVELTENAELIRQGNLSKRVHIEMSDEIGQLGNAFNEMVDQLQTTLNGLEATVSSRTRDLNIASQVSREITRELNPSELLPTLAKKTKEGFGLSHVSVFIFDETTQQLLLAAGTGKAGEHMVVEAKSFHIDARPSLVAQVARDRKAEIVNNTTQSPIHSFNLHLPQTKSEAAFPMVVGDDLVGVLDLQADTVMRFQESDSQIFSTLAEQIAIAVRNAQLYHEQERVAQELARTDLMKSQFLASMSHELRTPMNAIINLVDMVASEMIGLISEEQKTMLTQSLQSSRHLLHLINDVLDISKIQAGQLSLYLENDVDIYEELDTVTKIIEPLIKDHIKFIRAVDENIPYIEADRRRIRQILLNLLSNAAKFTEQGTITLTIKKHADHLLFSVIDTGPGIPESAHMHIFEPFVQTEDGRKKIEGTGLGLPISRNLAEAHRGKLWVESQPGEGAAFFFTLPYSQPIIPLK